MDFVAVPVLFFIPLLLWLGVWIWALVDVASHPNDAWLHAGDSKGLWILLILVFQFFGTVIYFLTVRPKLLLYDLPTSTPHN